MLTVRLPVELDQRLRKLAKDTDRTKAFYVRKALEATLDEFELRYLGEAEAYHAKWIEAEQARIYAVADAERATTRRISQRCGSFSGSNSSSTRGNNRSAGSAIRCGVICSTRVSGHIFRQCGSY